MTQNGTKETALEIWGNRTEIRDIAGRCQQMIPGIIKLPADLRQPASLAMAQISVMAGLNPFIGELWPIPQKSRRDGQVDGFQIMVGVKGLRRVARRQAKELGLLPPYYRPDWRWPTQEEREAMNLVKGDVAIVCLLELFLPRDHPFFNHGDERYTVEGIGLVRASYRGKMEPIQAARKRAESDALKMAFDIPLGESVVDADYEATDWIEVKPESEIPALVNRVDPDDWDAAMAMLVADGIIKTPLEVVDILETMKITYLDDDNFQRIMGLVCQEIERRQEVKEHVDGPMPAGCSIVDWQKRKAKEEAPLPRGPVTPLFTDDAQAGGDQAARAAQEAIFGSPGRAKARKAAQAAGQTSQRPLEGLTVESRAAIIGPQPWDPDKVLAYLQDAANTMRDQESPVTEKQAALLSRKGRELFAGTGDEDLKYHSLLMFGFGVSSTKALRKCEAGALLDWCLDGDRGPDGDYQLNQNAPEEAARILRAKMEEAGQRDMFKEAQAGEVDKTEKSEKSS